MLMPGRICFILVSLAGAAHAEHEFQHRDLLAGRNLYAQHCASCHGADLEGEANWKTRKEDGTMPAPPHDATGHTWHHDSLLLFEYTQLGGAGALAKRGITDFASAMPGFGETLSNGEIWDILAFIQSTWPEEVQDIQAARTPGHD